MLEAKTENGEVVDPSFVQETAIKAHKRINNWGYLPETQEEVELEDD